MNGTKTCKCGCGTLTKFAIQTDNRRGWKKGMQLDYVNGHNTRKSAFEYLVDDNGCWVWQRAIDGTGYGMIADNKNKTTIRAHRHYYEKLKGIIPKGLQIDHLCRNRKCVNPEHLEPVTASENMQRSHASRKLCTII